MTTAEDTLLASMPDGVAQLVQLAGQLSEDPKFGSVMLLVAAAMMAPGREVYLNNARDLVVSKKPVDYADSLVQLRKAIAETMR